MKRKFNQGETLYGEMDNSVDFPRYLGTLHPVVYQFESDEEENKCVCHLLAFEDQLPDAWDPKLLYRITKKNRKKKYNVGDKVVVKGHRGQNLDCGAKHVFLHAVITEKARNKRYKVKYDDDIYFPKKSKKLFIKRKNIYVL